MWAGREGGTSGHITAQEPLQREGLGGTRVLHFESDEQLLEKKGKTAKQKWEDPLAQKNLPCLFCMDINVSGSSK